MKGEEKAERGSERAGLSVPVFLLIAGVMVLLDQISKQIVVASLLREQQVEVIPGLFNLTLVYNTGVAFGMGSGLADNIRVWVLVFATAAAVSALLYFLLVDYRHDAFAQGAIAFVLGGAVGNVIDRVMIGSVVDFLDFYYGSYHWPAFNLADSAICLGVAALVLRKPAPKANKLVGEGPSSTADS